MLARESPSNQISLRALSVDAALLRGLGTSRQAARIHSVFERVVNLLTRDNQLLTLAHRNCDDAPATIVVDLESWATLGLVPGAGAWLSDRRIVLDGGLVIKLDSARQWRGALPPYPHDETALRANLAVAREYVERHGSGIALRPTPATRLTGIERASTDAFHRHARGLCRAIESNAQAMALEHVRGLVGLGPGLTPSGDDFLVGLLAALHIPGSPRRGWRRIGRQASACAARQTHVISATALRHAAEGRARAKLITLCEALMRSGARATLPAVAEVIGIGSSSGTEIALGVMAGFGLHLHAGLNAGEAPATSPARN